MPCDLCEELILEIFSRLPTKSLLRFRLVSKSLYACIGSRRFIHMHTLRSPNKVLIKHQVEYEGGTCKNMYTLHSGERLAYKPYIDTEVVKYPFLNFKIIGSCNGILCLHHCDYVINLWNPSTRRKVTVPYLPVRNDGKHIFYPIGFGFDPSIDDYKILMRAILDTTVGDEPGMFMYTMKTNTWREIPFPSSPFYRIKESHFLFNGSLHWVVKWNLTYSYILTFDLSSEVFSSIQLPEPSWETNQLTIINGHLAVISSKHEYSSMSSKDDDSVIWVRRDCNDSDSSSWSVAFKVNTHEFEGANRVFQLTPNGDLLFNPYYLGIIIYNPETGARSNFVGLSGSLAMLHVTPCVESLELLDMGTSCDQGKQVTKRRKRTE